MCFCAKAHFAHYVTKITTPYDTLKLILSNHLSPCFLAHNAQCLRKI